MSVWFGFRGQRTIAYLSLVNSGLKDVNSRGGDGDSRLLSVGDSRRGDGDSRLIIVFCDMFSHSSIVDLRVMEAMDLLVVDRDGATALVVLE